MTAKRTDANQLQIVKALREAGHSVLILSGVGKGCPDIMVGILHGGKRYNLLFEIKDGMKPPSQRKLTPCEALFFERWLGHARVVKSVPDAFIAVREYLNGVGVTDYVERVLQSTCAANDLEEKQTVLPV